MLKSHPDKTLKDHLLSVANNCKNILLPKTFGKMLISKEALVDLCFYTGLFHDVGKATKYFQKYILNPDKTTSELKNHANLSAILAFVFINKNLKSFDIKNKDVEKLVAYMVYNAIKRHHGYLHDFSSELPFELDKNLLLQIDALDVDGLNEIFDSIVDNLKVKIEIKSLIDELKNINLEEITGDYRFDFFDLEGYKSFTDEERIQLYLIQNLIYGTLILSDRKDVILSETPQIGDEVNFTKIENYRAQKFANVKKTPIMEIRSKGYKETMDYLEKRFDKNTYLYSLTLPTGLGKTILSLAIATKFEELLGVSTFRTVITIPFTSIIDQTFDVYKDIVATDKSNVLLKHHHRAVFDYKQDEKIYKYNESELLLETWHSEVVVTTFVQLLETIFSNDKQNLMKLPSIVNSIIVMDEVQTITYDLWKLINKTFKVLGEVFNTYFVLCTATQPLIFLPEKEIKEITYNNDYYFKYFNRTYMKPLLNNEVSVDEFQTDIMNYLEEHPDDDVIVIVNTKKMALELFKYFAEVLDENNDVFYLSTLITPYERKKIIDLIKNKTDKRKVIISTQLVEAGVDISVNAVFREIAPMDALIQSAGRANRNGEFDKLSPVFIYIINKNFSDTKKIYSIDLIQKTLNILKEYDIIYEINYRDLVVKYFNELYPKAMERDNKYLNAILNFDFNEVGKFELIKNIRTESIFVLLNQEAKDLFAYYIDFMSDDKLNDFEKNEKFATIKSRFFDYVINIQIPFDKPEISFDSEKVYGFYVADLDKTEFYKYSEDNFRMNTGYQNETSLLLF